MKRVIRDWMGIFAADFPIYLPDFPYLSIYQMNQDQLIAFERIVREGSFSRAAWALDIAQPTISARIRALEDEVGGALFVRGRRQVMLTEQGIAFLPYVRKVLATLGEGVEAARLAQRGERGRVSLGILGSLTGGFLTPVLARFHERYPDVTLHVEDGNHQQILEWLIDGVVELGMIAWPRTDVFAVDLTPLLHVHEEMVLAVAPHHPLAKVGTVTQEMVAEQSNPFLLMRWWQITPDPLVQLAARARAVYDLPMATGYQLVQQGIGAGFFNITQIADALAQGQLVPLTVADMPILYRDTAVVHVTLPPAPLSSPAQNLLDLLRQQGKQMGILQL
ncbi:MAG TPA: LysR family transcriptional regulator [Caldilineaceae bacterium]|nr:LysR family transcriptional regulator [Caldilineaceae bacterium]